MQLTHLEAAELTLKQFRGELEADCIHRDIPLSFLTVCLVGGERDLPFQVCLYFNRPVGEQGSFHRFKGATFSEAMFKAREGVKALAPTVDELTALIGVGSAA